MLNKMKAVERTKSLVQQERVKGIMITEDNLLIKPFSSISFDEKIDENYKGILLFTSETGYVKLRFAKPL